VNGARGRRQPVDEEADARIVAAGERTRRAKETRADHQPARDIVGPFDRGIEPVAQGDRDADHQQVGGQHDRRDRVAEREQRSQQPGAAGGRRRLYGA